MKVFGLVPPPVNPDSRHTLPFAAEHGSCTRPVSDADEPPLGVTHLPDAVETRLKSLSVPLTGTSRHCWLVPPWQGHWMTVASSAVDAPETSTHWPDWVVIVYVSPEPETGAKRKLWPAPEPHEKARNCVPFVDEPPGRSRQLPPFWFTPVDVNATAAAAGCGAARKATTMVRTPMSADRHLKRVTVRTPSLRGGRRSCCRCW